MDVLFRADASNDIGTGHVMRCMTLAEALREKNVRCRFVCREHPGNLLESIRGRGFEALSLPLAEADDRRSGVGMHAGHAAWLGADWQVDVQQTLEAVGNNTADWLIVDHYALNASWECVMHSVCRRVMVIDDLADRRHQCDLLLDQNWFADQTAHRYDALVPKSCIKLLGPKFALLRPEYKRLRKLMSPRDGSVRRVLIFMGGSDPSNVTAKALTSLLRNEFAGLEVDIVIGCNHPDVASIRELTARRSATKIYQNIPTLAELMVHADLMIGGGGATTWERMCLGLPAIVIGMADNQISANENLMRAGYVNYLGQVNAVDDRHIADEIHRLVKRPELLAAQSALCQSLVPGEGANRISEIIWSGGEV